MHIAQTSNLCYMLTIEWDLHTSLQHSLQKSLPVHSYSTQQHLGGSLWWLRNPVLQPFTVIDWLIGLSRWELWCLRAHAAAKSPYCLQPLYDIWALQSLLDLKLLHTIQQDDIEQSCIPHAELPTISCTCRRGLIIAPA